MNTRQTISPTIREIIRKNVAKLDEFKARNPEIIAIWHEDGFCYARRNDAPYVSKVCGLNIKTIGDGDDGYKEVSFPFSALDYYLPKLIRAGLRVAVVDGGKQPAKKVTLELTEDEYSAIQEVISAVCDSMDERSLGRLTYYNVNGWCFTRVTTYDAMKKLNKQLNGQ